MKSLFILLLQLGRRFGAGFKRDAPPLLPLLGIRRRKSHGVVTHLLTNEMSKRLPPRRNDGSPLQSKGCLIDHVEPSKTFSRQTSPL